MPISQDRFKLLLDAATSYQIIYENLRTILVKASRQVEHEGADARQLLINIAMSTTSEVNAYHRQVIGEEGWRWKLTHQKNEYDRERKQRQRRNLGIEPRAKRKAAPRTAAEVAANLEREEGPITAADMFKLETGEAGQPAQSQRYELSESEKAAILRQVEDDAKVAEALARLADSPNGSEDKD